MLHTIKAIDRAGFDLRAWCFRCARGAQVDAIIWMDFRERGWDDATSVAANRFRCASCGRCDEVLLVPATRPAQPPVTALSFVSAYFHGLRRAGKRRRE
ncbi:hypothetical protein [Sphingomonas sp. 67-36]|uniref:hypothetical protein n=1 Tax=Sphingomonas sp. 67-36 TaxID=1895849 RepID=UPI0025E031B6|nr:hypothetical protein [Sphingomonas sp. 67-36]